MANHTGNGCFKKGESGNPGGRPKLPTDIREAFKAKAPQALEVLTRCLQSDDDRIAMMAAQAILDRGYGKPTQSIDANINEDRVRYVVELPVKDETTEEWVKGNAAYLASTKPGGEAYSVGIDIRIARQCLHAHWVPSHPTPGINRGKYRYLDDPVPETARAQRPGSQAMRRT
jgi:Family of unknown function (DUF5681)